MTRRIYIIAGATLLLGSLGLALMGARPTPEGLLPEEIPGPMSIDNSPQPCSLC